MAYIGPLSPAEDALYTKDKVALRISKEDIGFGELVITERAFMWRPESQQNEGISIPWTSISLHAITSEPSRSIYMQLDFRLKWPGVYEANPAANGQNGLQHGEHGDEETDDDVDEGNVSDSSEESVATEIHIIPQDDNDINQIYYAMTHCQTMNPDPNDDCISEDEEDFMEAEGDESDDGHAEGEMRNLNLDDQQFADN